MQSHEKQSQPPGMSLGDIYYTLFRHKWKIVAFSSVGIVAAGLVYLLMPHLYSSEAKLFIRYVMDSRVPSGLDGDPQIKNPDPGGANIINSEIEILKSLDLAVQVAEAVGPEKILGKGTGETNKYTAAQVLQKNLLVEAPPRSDILRIVFQNPDKDVVQPVLSQLIDAYLRKHVEIHRSIGAFDDVLTQQTDALRSQLAQTEEDLRKAKTNTGLMSITETKTAYTEEISKIREALFNSQAELAEREASLQALQKMMPVKQTQASAEDAAVVIPSGKIDEYKSISGQLEAFRKKEQELLGQYTDESALVRSVREQIAAAQKAKEKLEADYPKLAAMQPVASQPGAAVPGDADDAVRITALQAKLRVLSAQLSNVTAQAESINAIEPAITELERKKDLEETKYRHFSTSLEQARFDEALGAGKMSNISVTQTPSPPFRESRQMAKVLGMIAGGGIACGIGLAFLLELFLDPTVRRPGEIETRLRLPLFLTIPESHKNGKSRRPAARGAADNLSGEPQVEGAAASQNGVAAWNPNGLRTYYEALRDRLVTYFEMRNLVHKPKLIAVTGCGEGAGVTTIATGLAASLSETGDGNVLLVNMTGGQGSAHPFFKGKPSCGLAGALENETRDSALVQENLYAVAEVGNGDKLSRILPRRFNSLVPKLKASDYDYIIFDMPPVSQISVTPRLASFMDMVLLVIESEKTDRGAAQRAVAMLSETKANVTAILNRTHRYVPERLLAEG